MRFNTNWYPFLRYFAYFSSSSLLPYRDKNILFLLCFWNKIILLLWNIGNCLFPLYLFSCYVRRHLRRFVFFQHIFFSLFLSGRLIQNERHHIRWEIEILLLASISRPIFCVCLLKILLDFFFILELPISFFVFCWWTLESIDFVSTLYLRSKTKNSQLIFYFQNSRKHILWIFFPPKSVNALELFRSLHVPTSHKTDSLQCQLKYLLYLSFDFVFPFIFL